MLTCMPMKKRKNEKNILNKYISIITIEFVLLFFILLVFTCKRVFPIYLMILPFYISSFQLNQIFMIENMYCNTLANIIMNLSNVIFSIFLLFLPQSTINALLVMFFKELFFIISTILLNWKTIKIRINKEICVYGVYLIKLGFLPMLTTMLITLNYRLDILFLNFFNINLYSIGLYSVGLNLAQYFWIIPDIFKYVLTKKSATEDFIESTTFSLRISSSIILLGIFIFILIGKPFIRILFGFEYSDSFYVTIILLIGTYSMIYTKLIGTIYYAEGNTRVYFQILLLSVICNIVLNIILIPLFLIYGAKSSPQYVHMV